MFGVDFGDTIGNPLADKLLRAVRDAGPDGLNGREMDRAAGGHASKAERDSALAALTRRELIGTHSEHTGERPTTITIAGEYADKADEPEEGDPPE